LYLSVFWHCL